jgi:hypothetical protein
MHPSGMEAGGDKLLNNGRNAIFEPSNREAV